MELILALLKLAHAVSPWIGAVAPRIGVAEARKKIAAGELLLDDTMDKIQRIKMIFS